MARKISVHLVIIDPQKDFMDDATAALPVPGANEDMRHVAAMIDRIGGKLEDIHVTLDSHRVIDVAHPGMWRDQNGDQPAPFTIVTVQDIQAGIWTPRNPVFRPRLLAYAQALEQQGNYPLMVWPEHCLIGTPGHNVQDDLVKALQRWERQAFANVDYVTKGTNAFTEHYGALMAEVPDPQDPTTGLNTQFLEILMRADIVAIAGEALSHCVRSTVQQIADNIGEDHIKKFYILTDAVSPVPAVPNGPDFPAMAQQWLKDMEARGMVLTTTEAFLNYGIWAVWLPGKRPATKPNLLEKRRIANGTLNG